MEGDIKDYCCVVTQEQANEAKELLQKYGETINGRADMFTIDRFCHAYLNILQYYDQNWRTGSDIGLHDKHLISYPQWKEILINQYEGNKPEYDIPELIKEVKSLREIYLELYKRVEELQPVTSTPEKPKYKIGEVYAFADIEEDFEKGSFKIENLTCIDKKALLPYRGKSLFYKYIRKIEYKFID